MSQSCDVNQVCKEIGARLERRVDMKLVWLVIILALVGLTLYTVVNVVNEWEDVNVYWSVLVVWFIAALASFVLAFRRGLFAREMSVVLAILVRIRNSNCVLRT